MFTFFSKRIALQMCSAFIIEKRFYGVQILIPNVSMTLQRWIYCYIFLVPISL